MAERRTGSKRSIIGNSRRGSQASSRRSQRDRDSGGLNDAQSAHPESGSTIEKPKKSGVSRFFSILNCCMAPSHANAVDPDAPEASTRRVTRTGAGQAAQSAPPTKQGNKSAEKVQPNPKDRLEQAKETSNFPQSAVTTSERKVPAPAQVEDPRASNLISDAPPSEGVDPTVDKSLSEKPLPASPKNPQTLTLPGPAEAGRSNEISQSSLPQTSVSPPTPILSSEEQVISDRTPEQKAKDEDIEMTDAPPSLPLAQRDIPLAESASNPIPHPEPTSKLDLPPPPPPTDRQAAPPPLPPEPQTARAIEPPSSALAATTEDRKWLLPPLRPELKGRKCLVLDLDETLVHSSFKVSPVKSL